jgi:inhibitor of KinA
MVTSERTLRFDFGSMEDNSTLQEFSDLIEREWNYLVEEVVPSYETVTIYFKRDLKSANELIEKIQMKWHAKPESQLKIMKRQIHIPVCYKEAFGEDLSKVLDYTGLTIEEVISLHTSPNYTVFAIGFLPGFPYLGGLPPELAVPRRSKPRLQVPKGAVGIGGTQTGIYPIESPGGWNLIGRTPLDLYDPNRAQPFLIQAGDRLTFEPISSEQFYEIKERISTNPDIYSDSVKEVQL